jgi:hypothetical protein
MRRGPRRRMRLRSCSLLVSSESARFLHNAETTARGLSVIARRGKRRAREFQRRGNRSRDARYDDAGNFRPLKTAPNLRRGWQLVLRQPTDVRLALEYFYPGRLAALAALKNGKLVTTPFRDTLARQTGMYRVAAKISDEQSDALIGNFCRSDGGCLRTILWKRDAVGTVPSTKFRRKSMIPLSIRRAAMNRQLRSYVRRSAILLVAEARNVVSPPRRSSLKPQRSAFSPKRQSVPSVNADSRFRLAFSNVTLFSRSRIWLRSSL